MNNLSQGKLAEMLYVTPQAVSRWENNETQPDLDTLGKLADIFETSIDEIVNGDKLTKRGFRIEQAYHLLCLVGGSISTIFSVIMIGLMIAYGVTSALEIAFVSVSMLFLVSVLVLEVKSRTLKQKIKDKKKSNKGEKSK